MSLFLEDLKPLITHKLLIELLELFKRVLVVLAGTLGENVHAEVSICNVFFVALLVTSSECVTLSLEALL